MNIFTDLKKGENKMNYYFTYHDTISGVYKSQVIDVINLYRNNGFDIRLIAFLSLKNFLQNYREIKKYMPDAIVVPSIPKQNNWKYNKIILNLFLSGNNNIVISRGVFATNICLELEKRFSKIIYDGRGAIAAERKEYGNSKSLEMISKLEYSAVINSDYRISVSKQLVNYWEIEYNYQKGNEVVIPCTLSINTQSNKVKIKKYVLEIFEDNDIIFVYSGSVAGWQSFDYLKSMIDNFLLHNQNIKILFLSKEEENITKLLKEYPDRIFRKWLKHEEVETYLSICDYGLLLREKSITNKVAAPVKFAEYLNAGLNIIISNEIGDYSEFVKSFNCGVVLDENLNYIYEKTTKDCKIRNMQLAQEYFSKSSKKIQNDYIELLRKDN